MNKFLVAHLAVLGANIIYGVNYVIAKGIMPDYLTPLGLLFIRGFFVVLIFWIPSIFLKNEKVEKRDLMKLFITAFFGVFLNQFLFYEGLNLSTPIDAALIITTIPVLVMIFARIILKEKITVMKTTGIILSFTGALAVIISAKGFSLSAANSLGNILILMCAASNALYLVLVKPLMMRYEPYTVIKWIFLFGFILFIPFSTKSFLQADFSEIPVKIWFSISYVIIAGTVIGYYLNNYSLRTMSPTVTGTYKYVQPVVATTVALIFGKDSLHFIEIIAAILIFAGVYLVSLSSNQKTETLINN